VAGSGTVPPVSNQSPDHIPDCRRNLDSSGKMGFRSRRQKTCMSRLRGQIRWKTSTVSSRFPRRVISEGCPAETQGAAKREVLARQVPAGETNTSPDGRLPSGTDLAGYRQIDRVIHLGNSLRAPVVVTHVEKADRTNVDGAREGSAVIDLLVVAGMLVLATPRNTVLAIGCPDDRPAYIKVPNTGMAIAQRRIAFIVTSPRSMLGSEDAIARRNSKPILWRRMVLIVHEYTLALKVLHVPGIGRQAPAAPVCGGRRVGRGDCRRRWGRPLRRIDLDQQIYSGGGAGSPEGRRFADGAPALL